MSRKFLIVSPCYNEGNVVTRLLDEIAEKLKDTGASFSVLMVDDGSQDETLDVLKKYAFALPQFDLKVIKLKYNMGHQEAIRQGLNYARRHFSNVDGIIVMDSDGEDDPRAIAELVKLEHFEVVFVERGKRKEKFFFKFGYFYYQLLFRLITGKKISFGNYSMIHPRVLNSIADQHFIHYAGFLSKQKFEMKKLQFDRQYRIDGKSKMNYKSLVFHGLYSFLEYAEEILFSLIKLFGVLFVALMAVALYVLYSKYISHNAIAGWASAVGSGLMVSSLIIVSTIILGLLLLSIKKLVNQKNDQYDEVS